MIGDLPATITMAGREVRDGMGIIMAGHDLDREVVEHTLRAMTHTGGDAVIEEAHMTVVDGLWMPLAQGDPVTVAYWRRGS